MQRIIINTVIIFIVPTVIIYYLLGKFSKNHPLLSKIRIAFTAVSVLFWSTMTGIYYNDTFTQNPQLNDGYYMSDVMHFLALEDDSVFYTVSSESSLLEYNPMHNGLISGFVMITLSITLLLFSIEFYIRQKRANSSI